MTALQGAGQVPLCAASKEQEVVVTLASLSQLFICELHCDSTLALQRTQDKIRVENTEQCKIVLF